MHRQKGEIGLTVAFFLIAASLVTTVAVNTIKNFNPEKRAASPVTKGVINDFRIPDAKSPLEDSPFPITGTMEKITGYKPVSSLTPTLKRGQWYSVPVIMPDSPYPQRLDSCDTFCKTKGTDWSCTNSCQSVGSPYGQLALIYSTQQSSANMSNSCTEVPRCTGGCFVTSQDCCCIQTTPTPTGGVPTFTPTPTFSITPTPTLPLCSKPVTLMYTLDRSGSMGYAFGVTGTPTGTPTPRLSALKLAVQRVAPQINYPGSVQGMVSFADTARVDVNINVTPPPNYTAVITAVNGLTASGGTDILAGFNLSKTQLLNKTNPVILFVTDADISPTPAYQLVTAINAAQADPQLAGLKVFAIGVDLNPTRQGYLSQIAAAGDGSWGNATDPAGLDTLVQSMVSIICNYTLQVNVVGSGSVVENPDQPSYPAGTVVTLTANPNPGWTFTSWSGDPDCTDGKVTMNSNKTCTATFTIIPTVTPTKSPANLSTSVKIAVPTIVTQVGQTITYTITLNNSGQQTATNVVLNDPIPLGTNYTSGSVIGGNWNSTLKQIEWTGSIPGNSTHTVTFKVTVPIIEPATVHNVAHLWLNGQQLPDLTADTQLRPPTPTPTLSPADFSTSLKIASVDVINKADYISYTITLTNTGGMTASVFVTDSIPTATTYVEGSVSGAVWNPSLNRIEWTGSISGGGSASFSFTIFASLDSDVVVNRADVNVNDVLDRTLTARTRIWPAGSVGNTPTPTKKPTPTPTKKPSAWTNFWKKMILRRGL